MPTLKDQLDDVRIKIRNARFANDMAALAVLEPMADRLLDAMLAAQVKSGSAR
jgi:hypothetical protein